jgi:hypothetical protein
MAATSRIFPFLPSLHNSIFAQHQAFQYCSNFVRAFAENTLLSNCFSNWSLTSRKALGLEIPLTLLARDDIYATQPARSSARAGHGITGRLSSGGALGIRGGNLWLFDDQSIFRPSALAALKLMASPYFWEPALVSRQVSHP